jgi:hypothetical protein
MARILFDNRSPLTKAVSGLLRPDHVYNVSAISPWFRETGEGFHFYPARNADAQRSQIVASSFFPPTHFESPSRLRLHSGPGAPCSAGPTLSAR